MNVAGMQALQRLTQCGFQTMVVQAKCVFASSQIVFHFKS